MKSIITSAVLVFLFHVNSLSQTTYDFQSEIFKIQKGYINTNIKDKEKTKYLTLLHFSNVLQPRILAEIQKLNPIFPAIGDPINLLEKWNGYGNIEGAIWQGDSNYYCYKFSSGKNLDIQQKTYAQLSNTAKALIQHFNNWSHQTFSINGQSLNSPTDQPFYFASKFFSGAAHTIGFYYQ